MLILLSKCVNSVNCCYLIPVTMLRTPFHFLKKAFKFASCEIIMVGSTLVSPTSHQVYHCIAEECLFIMNLSE